MNPAHLDYDVLADLAEGLLEDDEAASVNAHLESCAECRDLSADLADVSRLLAEAPVPSIPAELAERIDTAIAAESLNATVVSLEQRRGRRHWRILSAAAAAVIVVGGGAAVGTIALGEATGEDSGASAPAPDYSDPTSSEDRKQAPKAVAPTAGPPFRVLQSGTDYRAADLGAQIGDLLHAPQAHAAAVTAGPRLRECVYAVTQGRTPELVDEADYEGKPAYVIAARGDQPGKWNVWVVGTHCSADDPDVLKTLESA